jgi:hypothetical protein
MENINLGFQELVRLAGKALKEEDCLIGYQNFYYKERFLQYIMFRSLYLSLSPQQYLVEAERECFDINIFKLPNKQNYAALLEITCWRSVIGENEIPKIKGDIIKLKEKDCPGFIIICTVNPKDQTNENIEFLSKGLSLENQPDAKLLDIYEVAAGVEFSKTLIALAPRM